MKSPHWRSVVIDTQAAAEADIACHASFGVAALARVSGDDFAPEAGDPARSIGTGPSVVASGVVGAVIGCDGADCEFELEATKTYTALNGHRMVARLQHHPRTGAVIYDYKGDPKYAQWGADHADDCPCLTSEEGDGGAEFEAINRWEFPGDYE